jgi:hypothetical protein
MSGGLEVFDYDEHGIVRTTQPAEWWLQKALDLMDALDAAEAENERLTDELEQSRNGHRITLYLLDEAQLRSIEARNPGIDMEDVRRSRMASKAYPPNHDFGP